MSDARPTRPPPSPPPPTYIKEGVGPVGSAVALVLCALVIGFVAFIFRVQNFFTKPSADALALAESIRTDPNWQWRTDHSISRGDITVGPVGLMSAFVEERLENVPGLSPEDDDGGVPNSSERVIRKALNEREAKMKAADQQRLSAQMMVDLKSGHTESAISANTSP